MRKSFFDLFDGLKSLEVEENGFASVLSMLKSRPRLFFIGNGGSAAIASHMAADYMKNGRFATFCMNDGAALTCISNDLGYENVFSLPIARHGQANDVLFAISSSGESKSITHAVLLATGKWMNTVTLSGFKPDNTLRKMGFVNFYVPSMSYGTVEISHLAILHSILDEVMTWR